eukprot:g11878.t1
MPLAMNNRMSCRRALRLPALVMALVMVLLCVRASVGSVISLGDADFDEFVRKLPDDVLLLVDFYKPSCRACQKLNPALEYLETKWEEEEPDASKRWFQLAKVDVEENTRLRTVFGIRKIPDLRFVRAGQFGTYEGGKSIEAITEFKERMAPLPLRYVEGDELVDLAKAEDAVFVLSADAEVDPSLVAPGVKLAATMSQHMATFCVTSPAVLSSLGIDSGASSSPAMLIKVVAAPGGQGQGGTQLLRAAVYNGKGKGGGDSDMDIASASSWDVLDWVERERFGLVSEFTADNFSRLGALGKLMVMGVVDPKHEDTASFDQTFAKVASKFGVKHADKLIFGTVNRVKMAGFVETFNIYEGHPRVVVMDMSEDVFYSVENLRLGVGEIEAFLIDVLAGYIPAQVPSTNSARYVMKAWWVIQNGGAWSFLLLIPFVGLLWVFCDSPQREEAREARRQARQAEKEEKQREEEKVTEAMRLKTD